MDTPTLLDEGDVLARCARVREWSDADVRRIRIKLGIEKDETGQYDDKNKVLRVRSIDGSDGGGEDNSPQSTATAMPTPQGSPPTGEAAAKSQPAPNRPASPGPGGSAPWRKAS